GAECPDRELLDIKPTAALVAQYRIGVLDVYDGQNWLLPPYAESSAGGAAITPPAVPGVAGTPVTIAVKHLSGAFLPIPAEPGAVTVATSRDLRFNERSDVLGTDGSNVEMGTTYTMDVPPTPAADELLRDAGTPPPPE